MDDFEAELRTGFLEEAAQLLSDAEQCFLNLETHPDDPSLVENLFRLAHNIKGSAKAVGFEQMSVFTHELESLLLKLKRGEIKIEKATVDLLLCCGDELSQMIATLKADPNAKIEPSELIPLMRAHAAGEIKPVHVPSNSPPSAPNNDQDLLAQIESQTTAIKSSETAVFDESLFDQIAEQTAQLVQTVTEDKVKKSAKNGGAKVDTGDDSIRVSIARLERLLNFVGELVILHSMLAEQSRTEEALLVRKTIHQMGKITRDIRDMSMGLRMVPLKQTFQKMLRIVRDSANELGKKIQLDVDGDETEVDKTVLEHLSDPLVHIIRNSADHGIESPDARARKGKPPIGSISLIASHQSGKLVIEIKDDGGGIDPEVIGKKAIEKGVIPAGTTLTQKQANELIFHPGFSTKAQVTDLSGRGIGMDVVKTNIERLQGEVSVDSVPGQGTTITIVLPLTLAIIEGMLVSCESERYMIPLSHVYESFRPTANDVRFATNVGDVLMLRDENLPIYRLCDLLGKKTAAKKQAQWSGSAIVVRTQAKPFAVLVDEILGQNQIVIKKLGPEIRNVRGFSGSAILGDGRPALILELNDLIAAAKAQRPIHKPAAA